MLRILYFIFILTALNASSSFAFSPYFPTSFLKVEKAKIATVKTDTAKISVRYFDKAALDNYRKNPDFQYGETDSKPSFLARAWRGFWSWFWHLFDFLKPDAHHARTFWEVVLLILEYVLIILGLAAIVFLILKMAGMDVRNLLRRKSVSANLPYNESLENIHDIDFETELERAIANGNYRLAVRILYLNCLKQLSDATIIKWQPEKTNSAYINEINDIEQRSAFKLLTRQFEYIWYGEFAIDNSIFSAINSRFQKFKKDIA